MMEKICKSFWTSSFVAVGPGETLGFNKLHEFEINIESSDHLFPMADALEEAYSMAKAQGLTVSINHITLKNALEINFEQFSRTRAIRRGPGA